MEMVETMHGPNRLDPHSYCYCEMSSLLEIKNNAEVPVWHYSSRRQSSHSLAKFCQPLTGKISALISFHIGKVSSLISQKQVHILDMSLSFLSSDRQQAPLFECLQIVYSNGLNPTECHVGQRDPLSSI